MVNLRIPEMTPPLTGRQLLCRDPTGACRLIEMTCHGMPSGPSADGGMQQAGARQVEAHGVGKVITDAETLITTHDLGGGCSS